MVALRIVFRCAFQTANTLNYDNSSGPRGTRSRDQAGRVMGQPTQATGTANESNAVSPSAGFIGWSPEPDRTVYRVTSATRTGPVEVAVSGNTRTKQYYR
jgi:hypothetical protein